MSAFLVPQIDRLNAELKDARVLLFMTHTCSGKYGDDGEMQCARCGIDFKRDTIAMIQAKIIAVNDLEYSRALKSPPNP